MAFPSLPGGGILICSILVHQYGTQYPDTQGPQSFLHQVLTNSRAGGRVPQQGSPQGLWDTRGPKKLPWGLPEVSPSLCPTFGVSPDRFRSAAPSSTANGQVSLWVLLRGEFSSDLQ